MADIQMCGGEGCAIKEKCHRHTAPRSPLWQAMMRSPMLDGDQCDEFWPNDGYARESKCKKPTHE